MHQSLLKSITLLAVVLILITVFSVNLDAQCPMCRMAAESNLKNGGTMGRGLNNGILYLLATPYLLIGGLAYFWWRNRRKNVDADTQEPVSA
jgi:hypothetical protein